jgi:chloride channel protein, CIC family
VFAFELTRDYNAILPLMLATVVADLVSAALLDHGLMTEKLARRGLEVPTGYQPDVLQSTRVGEAMTPTVEVLPADATAATARQRLQATGHSAYPIVDAAGRCTGMVTRGDLLAHPESSTTPVGAFASTDVVSVTPDASLLDVLERMVEEGIDHLPVVDRDNHLVGICTRTDILRARSRHLVHERVQPGWRMTRATKSARARGRGGDQGIERTGHSHDADQREP